MRVALFFLFFSTHPQPKGSAGFPVGGTCNFFQDVEVSGVVFNLNDVNSSSRENKHRHWLRKRSSRREGRWSRASGGKRAWSLSISSSWRRLEKMWTSGACAEMRGVGIGDESPSKCQRVASKNGSRMLKMSALNMKIFSAHDAEGISISPVGVGGHGRTMMCLHRAGPEDGTRSSSRWTLKEFELDGITAWFGWVLGIGAGFGFASVYAYLEPELEGEAISPLGDNGMVGEEIEQGWNINAVEKVENRRE
ncbi:hypothetical protein K438DRAFT_1770333 [Mycena galopus ATCC 62051]|nr:hypothetical protein K438DRAFT_1770333 [Mycena galopus ATCC 62051]